MREFQADVGVEILGSNIVQQLVIEGGTGARFFRISDVLAQIIDGDCQSRLVQLVSNAECVFHLRAGHEAAGEFASERRALGESPQSPALREGDEKRSQHGQLAEAQETQG